MRKLWIAWENHRRTKELARAFNANLQIYQSDAWRIIKYPVLVFKTLLLIIRYKPDVVYVQNPSVVLALEIVLIKKIFGYLTVVDLHNAAIVPEGYLSRKLYPFYRYIHKNSDVNIVTNAQIGKVVKGNGGKVAVLPDKIPVIPCGKTDYNISTPSFVYICTYAPDEPYIEVVEAARLLDPGIHLYITGDSRKCPAEISMNLPINVTLTGFLSDNEYFELLKSVSGVIVLTSRENCLLCGAYEAVSLEKPLILSNKQALVDYFGEDLLYCNNDRLSLSQAMNIMLDKLCHYNIVTTNVKANLSLCWYNYLNTYEGLFQELLRRKMNNHRED